jgi:hypothetical protein
MVVWVSIAIKRTARFKDAWNSAAETQYHGCLGDQEIIKAGTIIGGLRVALSCKDHWHCVVFRSYKSLEDTKRGTCLFD